jgi:hypothetical protein
MNPLVTIIIAVLVTAAVMAIGFVIYQRRKSNPGENIGDSFFNSWEKIRPILTDLFIDGVALYDASQGTYDDLEMYAVDWILRKINGADFLLPEEKALFTYDRVVKLIRPRLQEWYNAGASANSITE